MSDRPEEISITANVIEVTETSVFKILHDDLGLNKMSALDF